MKGVWVFIHRRRLGGRERKFNHRRVVDDEAPDPAPAPVLDEGGGIRQNSLFLDALTTCCSVSEAEADFSALDSIREINLGFLRIEGKREKM